MSGNGEAVVYHSSGILQDTNSKPCMTNCQNDDFSITPVMKGDMNSNVQSQTENTKTVFKMSENEENSKNGPCQEITNGLIDEFSTQLTMSLINSSVSPAEQSVSDHTISTDGASQDLSLHSTAVSQDDTNSNPLVCESDGISYLRYQNETQMSAIMQLITKDLSEPYSIYTYRYFIHNWPQLCFLAKHGDEYVGAIVCKLDLHKKISRRGYIAMLAVDKSVRRRNIGTNLVKMAIETMHREGCDEVVLETEVTNKPALRLYENLGFVRDKRLFRYYLNGVDALRLKLWL